jgi:hypothetical protein
MWRHLCLNTETHNFTTIGKNIHKLNKFKCLGNSVVAPPSLDKNVAMS